MRRITGRGTSRSAMATIRTRCHMRPNSGRPNWVSECTPFLAFLELVVGGFCLVFLL